ncbi:MAG: sulfide-dependent adenosine diphosphate thiazole synthase [Conexivisphaera sp.]|jgi:thiamine thiazole synthase
MSSRTSVAIDEPRITRAILAAALRDWEEISSVDVAVVGAGPSGMAAAYYLSRGGLRTVVFERRLGFGGGIGGGAMFLHKIVVEPPADEVLRDVGARYAEVEGDHGLLVLDAAELMAKLASSALDAGAKIVHGVSVEDVIFRRDPLRVAGVVVNWTASELSGLHVDPLFVSSRAVVDATGHEASVVEVASRKVPELGIELRGERSAYSELSESLVVEGAGEVAPGLYACGMAVAKVRGLPRMGPIFGAMLLSGRKVALEIAGRLGAGRTTP